MVQSLQNTTYNVVNSCSKTTTDIDNGGFRGDGGDPDLKDILCRAVASMTRLRRANVTKTVIGVTILESLDAYTHLRDLTIHELSPLRSFWKRDVILPLTSLRWELQQKLNERSPSKYVHALVNSVVAACPDLRSLDIICEDNGPQRAMSMSSIQHFFPSGNGQGKRLENLEHFGF